MQEINKLTVWAVMALLAGHSFLPPRGQAITIDTQFATGTLFSPSADAQAREAIEAAAADISEVITSSLGAITTDMYVGRYLDTTATFDWSFSYKDPSTNSTFTLDTATAVADTVTLYVGTRSLLQNTLGVGGPGGLGSWLQVSGPAAQVAQQSPEAVDNAETLSEAAYNRGGGPVIGSLDGIWDAGDGYVDHYSIDYGIALGSLALDNDADNNGNPDSESQLNNYWHWDHTTPVSAGKNDLYSVALHEILHAIGIGLSDSWDSLTSGTTWNGAEVQALTGSGANLIDGGGGHIASSVMSTRISDGLPQEVVMDPTITTGTRKELTELDLAFLRDIGYSTILPTQPADFDEDGYVDGSDLAIFRTSYGVDDLADANGDGVTDGKDFLIWQRQYTGPPPAAAVAQVPAPSSTTMLLVALLLAPLRLRGIHGKRTMAAS